MNFIGRVKNYLLKENKVDFIHKNDIGKINKGALQIMNALEKGGYEAYLVGGSVRDLLLEKVPHDWDITTSARPDEIVSCAIQNEWKIIDRGGYRFGTVSILINENIYEVTTFRSDFYGNDSHRPKEICFAKTLKDDLSRRDFTVNAIAIDADGVIYDYFGGIADLDRRILRTVGIAKDRFQEDALRLFRACRFLGQLDFQADKELFRAISPSLYRVEGLSLSRVKSELQVLMKSDHPARGLDLFVRSGLNQSSCFVKVNKKKHAVPILPELSHLVDLPQEKQFHKFDAWNHTLAVVEASPREDVLRWAALFHDVGKGMPGVRAIRNGKYTDYGHDSKGAEISSAVLIRLAFPPSFISRVVWLVKNHMRFHYFANTEAADGKKWLRQISRSGVFKSSADMRQGIKELMELCKADIIGCGRPFSATNGHQAFGEYMMDLCEEMPVSTKDLRYDERLISVLKNHIGEGMKNLLFRVQNGELRNEPETLLEAGNRYRRRHNEEN